MSAAIANLTAEQRLLGACLTDPSVLDFIVDKLGPGDFSDWRLGLIYSATARVAAKGTTSATGVVEELRISGELADIGGDRAITWLASHPADIDEAKEAAEVILDLAKRRDQVETAYKAATVIAEGGDASLELAKLNHSSETTDGWTDLAPIVNGILTGTHNKLEPSLLQRSDDEFLLYEGRLNLLFAPPESMKSWLSKLTCIQVMQTGRVAVYVDCEESDGVTCAERLFSIASGMGISQDTLRDWLEGPVDEETGQRDPSQRLFYYKAESTGLGAKSRAQVLRLVRSRRVPFVVIDGFAAAMASHTPPLEEDKAKDVNLWLTGAVWPIVAAGAGVLVIDHVTKSAGSAGSAGVSGTAQRGSGAKLAAVSGVALQATVVTPGSATQPGRVKLWVVKDRLGRVKIVHESSKRLGGVLVSQPLGDAGGVVESTRLQVLSPEAAHAEAAEKRWDLICAEQISRLLREHREPMAKTELKETLNERRREGGGTGWRGDTLVKAIAFLTREGWCSVEKDGKTEMVAATYPYLADWGEIHADDRPAAADNPFGDPWAVAS